MAKWIVGLAASAAGSLVSLIAVWFAASEWNEFSDHWLYSAWILPLLGFFLGYVPVAKHTGEWPVEKRSIRFLFSGILAVHCAALGYLSFLVASFIWNEAALPPEQASVIYLLVHPDDIPPLREIRKEPGKEARESTVTWHKGVIIGFFVGGFCGFVYAAGAGGRL
jgi:hypothetical protein